MASYKAHVIVVPYPAQGHINPMLQFCKRLVSKGLRVTLANTVFLSKSMHIGGGATTNPESADHCSSVHFETISDGYDDGGFADAESTEAYVENLRVVGSRTLAHLIRKLGDIGGHPVHAVVYDSFLPWALDVSKSFGLVGAAFSTQLCSILIIYYHLFKDLLSLPLSSNEPLAFPGLPLLEPRETPSFLHDYGSYPGFFSAVISQFSNLHQADWVLFNIFYKLEEDALNWMGKLFRVATIGPTVPSMYLDKRLENDKNYGADLYKPADSSLCMKWLTKQGNRSVVYVSFGSWTAVEVEQTVEIASALKDGGFKFLWVVRESEMEKLPNRFLEETEGKGLVVKWCSQLEVLAHVSVACFVTHCGFNSVLEALSQGVPMVGMPQWTDQTTNAKFIEDVWGVGLRTKVDEKGIVRKENLESCLGEIMEGDDKGREIRKNAERWKLSAREALENGGCSDKNIDLFVEDLACFSFSNSSKLAG